MTAPTRDVARGASAETAAEAPVAARVNARSRARIDVRELVGLAGLLVVAALLRFVDLPSRGAWDADQGHDMLVLQALVRDGVVPLLGPPTSIGDFHHGVLYYYVLAPFAAIFGADPLAVVAAIAVAGVAAVAVTWWIAREIGGAVAAFVAAALMAVSAAAVEESTFIWNPNLIALSSAVLVAAAWRAWTTGRARWWIVAAVAQAVTMHCHVLGCVLLVPLVVLVLADVRRRPAGSRAPLVRAAIAGAALIVLSYVPLATYELTHGFPETHAAAAFVAGGGDPSAASPPLRLLIVALRIVAWPLTGLITDAPVAALLAVAGVIAIIVWRSGSRHGRERVAVRAFAATLAWCAVALALGASSLATVVKGLPNDHYHAFLDPIVFVIAGLGAAALWRLRQPAGPAIATAAVAVVVAFNVAIRPPAVAPDGGWPAARDAATRILATVGDRDYIVVGVPAFKSADAYGFPLDHAGRPPVRLTDAMGYTGAVVVVCDRLFEEAVGTPCGGPSEDATAAQLKTAATLAARFDASARTTVSIYR
ncbi:MAG TPA: glycosyltransferase family 39 protein [Candidatus Limnocylindrales bacterium]|nr:glycosyltransferase family 39 protein [Candidatus Limnocylindrales bacterium]